MVAIYSACEQIVAIFQVLGQILAKAFFTPFDEWIAEMPKALQTLLTPIDWLLDLLTIGEASLITIMFTVGVNIWMIMAIIKFFK